MKRLFSLLMLLSLSLLFSHSDNKVSNTIEKKLTLMKELFSQENASNLESRYKILINQIHELEPRQSAPLFAPWRSEYDKKNWRNADDKKIAKIPAPCPFCYKFSQAQDRDNLILRRMEHTAVKLNLHPYTPGHMLVLPYRHVAALEELSAQERHELIDSVAECVSLLKKAFGNEFCNIGANLGGQPAGGSIPGHLHFHVVPRWIGDSSFMGTIAGTQIIGSDSVELYDFLKPYFALNCAESSSSASATKKLSSLDAGKER